MPPAKKILLMRHAKSSWNDMNLRDFDRPLNKRGRNDAPKMGRYLKHAGLIPDQIFSSPAARAKATIYHIADEIGMDKSLICWEEDLYYGGAESYFAAIRNAEEHSSVVMTVGHNPMIEQAITALSETSFDKDVPTASIACFETSAESWKDLHPGGCKLLWFVTPRSIEV